MELFRYQASILKVLFNQDSSTNANVLASLINSSLKTVKKEIDLLNVVCKSNGFEVMSQPGSGYQIKVYNRGEYENFVDIVTGMYNRNLFYENSQDERVHYAVRAFLIRRNISIYELMDECNCSESSIRRDMSKIKEMFCEYKLGLINRTNKGMSLEGDEWHIRLALMHERYAFMFKHKVYYSEESDQFEKMFLSNDNKLTELIRLIQDVATKYRYTLSYDAIMRFSVMMALSITRNKYSSELSVDKGFYDVDISLEKEIIHSIWNNYSYLRNSQLSTADEIYLSIFLKSVRLLRFNILNSLPEREMILEIIDGFFMRLRKTYDMKNIDVSILYKDLSVGLFNLYYSAMLDSHIIKYNIYQQIKDGLINLDLCSQLYLYLKNECNINCNQYDISAFYHAFLYFSSKRDEFSHKRILVVAAAGYFMSRSLANMINKRNSNIFVEYVPMEYIDMKNCNMNEYDGIISDISALKEEYPQLPFVSLSFFRNRKTINKFGQNFVFDEARIREIFTAEDLHYTDRIKTKDDIYSYLRKIVNYDKTETYLKECRLNSEVYGGTRTNNCYLLNPFKDYIGKSFLKIICLKEAIRIDEDIVNKIIIYNVAGNSLFERAVIASSIGSILHHSNTYISFNPEKDYDHLVNILNQ